MSQIPSARPGAAWLWRMAWRDSRRSRSRLLLFISAIVLGIAALVGINGFGDNLARTIDEQAQELLGADLVLSASQPLKPEFQPMIGPAIETATAEAAFPSLVQFPKGNGVRLAQVRALAGDFPYYGTWLTEPTSAVQEFRQAWRHNLPVALVDDALLIQFAARVGDSIQVGRVVFRIAGRVRKTPGQSDFNASVAPTVFIPGDYQLTVSGQPDSASLLARTQLIKPGSRVQYRAYYKLRPGVPAERLRDPLVDLPSQENIRAETVASRKQQTGRAFSDLTRFLNLVAFVALLLGCVGVASSVSLYVREKVAAVAVLRCLGASGRQALFIYLLQTALMGLVGAIVGAALGTAIQLLLPKVFAGFLPVVVATSISWKAVSQGVITGLLVAVLFALLPLLSIRRVSPLRTLRASYEEDTARPDPLRLVVFGLISLFMLGFAYLQTRDIKLALGFTVGILVAFGVLAGLGQGLRYAVRRFFPASWSYVWRQGLANLYRPNNQTLLLTVSIGLGVFLMATLYLMQGLLLSRVQLSASGNQPNLVLFDIQSEQKAGVGQLLQRRGLPILQQVPIVTMRLASINGRTISELKKDTTNGPPARGLTREYRVTYRDTLNPASETLAAGKAPYVGADKIPRISMDEYFAQRLKLKLNDTLVFNVQGAPLTTILCGTRTIDWSRVQTNFLVVFPTGVLEPAPQFHVFLTRVPNNQVLGAVQRDLVAAFPNVSAIDLGLVLQTIDDILSKISFVIRFMALFSIATGVVVLISSVMVSRYQRVQESVLLRTLGASRRQILRITLVEYALLGLLAAVAGLLLAVVAAWALAVWVFEVAFVPPLLPLLVLAALTTALTVLIGLLNSRDVLTRPPLEILRGEA
ncbi:putative ABC transport system permease protein [Hymenobacter gelipurpurascens]|uniref:Putative ABC transport system permease protein n=1 Tax=Hymenobacter gelipurpurascens TaxID=89968 RepID=A0A212UEC3_9BACT|nr:FtsX-like permease family protein [Hymenobacter gelipurpurascens]SNC76587.1 putative ABC transport system permease protein [Hymenobacter gelipurpurascens]